MRAGFGKADIRRLTVVIFGGIANRMSSLPDRPVIILVRPQMAENIGMSARAMANFGLSEMRLVAPRDGWPQKARMKKGAVSTAAGATHVLDGAQHFETVEAAIADLHHVYATTARFREQAKPVETPVVAMEDAARRIAAGQRVGVMFGAERAGLENDEVALASSIITFPVSPDFPSLNLAQAVLLTGYEWYRHAGKAAAPFGAPELSPPASRGMLTAFFEHVEAELEQVDFFRPAHKKPVMVRNFRNIIHRMNPSEQDLRTMRGALVLLQAGGRVAGRPRRRRGASEAPPGDTASSDPSPIKDS
jgi:tRNA/rRNA methyltransferase